MLFDEKDKHFPSIKDATSTGYFQWGDGFKTWYRITGDLNKSSQLPLICCHGGPGAAHSYILAMTDLATEDRAVIHYDQLGCGKSTRLPERNGDRKFWTVELFLQEFNGLVKHLRIKEYILLGQSWGGLLALCHAVKRPHGLKALISADGVADFDRFEAGCAEWIKQLPVDAQEAIRDADKKQRWDSPEFLKAQQLFYDRYLCRIVPNPPEVTYSFEQGAQDKTVFETMNGPTEFTITGSLKGFSVENKLHRINVPTLILSGRFDEVSPPVQHEIHKRIKGSEWIIYESSSHLPHVEEREKWVRDVSHWLARQDAKRSDTWWCTIA